MLDLEKVRAWANHKEHSAADCEHGDKILTRLADDAERLRGLLARLEWAGQATPGERIGTVPRCPVCRVVELPHDRGCWLASELSDDALSTRGDSDDRRDRPDLLR